MDEMWGRVYCKKTPCWLWHAINHDTGEIVAYVFGTREHEVLQKLLAFLSGLNVEIAVVFSGDSFAYRDIMPMNILHTGKRNTQRVECKYLTFCTRLKRLVRRTVCCSKSLEMHTTLLGLLINVLEFKRKLF
jgi:insertion element IS1 protein InsB